MPTRRAFTFLFISFLLYLFANQTQVGWLYVMSALMAGVLVVAFILNRDNLHGITGWRKIGSDDCTELYEGDETEIYLTFKNKSRFSAMQIRTTEICPLVDPQADYHRLDIFLPTLPANQESHLQYGVHLYRRGFHEFSHTELFTGAPFGLFKRRRMLAIPTRVLVYPELRPLKHLDLLDRQPSVNLSRPRAGWGTEVIGVRPYRPGDSLRHIHWLSVARTGQMISKEFLDESQPGLTLALDLFPHPLPKTSSKHTPFEWMVKLAASIGDYAIRRGYALHLLADETTWPPPRGPLTRQALLEYLARVHPSGENPLANLLDSRNTQTFVAATFPYPDQNIVAPLLSLKQQGIQTLAIFPNPEHFPDPGPSAYGLVNELTALGIETRLVEFGEDWVSQLSVNTRPYLEMTEG